MDTIAIIGVSQTSIRVVLTAERIVYAGKWRGIPDWFDIGRKEAAYMAEFRVLATHMVFKQLGQNDVQIFANSERG
jgi:hypothetical protein